MTTFDERLGYQFRDRGLLEQALCHRSAGKPNNERLEFLGDAVLGVIVSELLYRRFPSASEGELSRLRSQLVQRSTLAEIARELRMGDVLRLGMGELKSGGANRESILADALEALVSALYLDSGLAACTERVEHWLGARLQGLTAQESGKDAKTRLQEWLQARQRALPVYSVDSIAGQGHQQSFAVSCRVEGLSQPLTGSGSSRKEAEQKAAASALQLLESGGE
ncbi:MAG TPA: ribonuclease III [Candidatus Acidoferrum sp.]|nr:ribonuclease III [Candidatus Acidoferrum sp.]